MNDVGSHRDMHRHGNAEFGAGRQNARPAMGKLSLGTVDVMADGFAHSLAGLR